MTAEHIERMEMAVLGSIMLDPAGAAPKVFARIAPDQFASRNVWIAEAIYSRIADNEPVTPELVIETLRQQSRMRPETGPAISDMVSYAYSTPSLDHYIDALADVYLARDAYQMGARLMQMSQQSDVHTTLAYASQHLDRLRTAAAVRQEEQPTTLASLLLEEPEPIDWLMPGLVPAADRLLVTAEEGMGKSTLLRQFALSLALGVQPLSPDRQMQPRRALLIDAEVSRSQLVRSLRQMYSFASRHTHAGTPDWLVVESRQGGIDLADPAEQGWLLRLVRNTQPSLLAIGPLYRITSGDMNDEGDMRVWQRLMEPLLETGLSIIMEHHSPQPAGGIRRDLRPIGSSVIRRWFSQGVGVRGMPCEVHDRDWCRLCARKGKLELWRGSRDQTEWPTGVRSPGSDLWWLGDERVDFL